MHRLPAAHWLQLVRVLLGLPENTDLSISCQSVTLPQAVLRMLLVKNTMYHLVIALQVPDYLYLREHLGGPKGHRKQPREEWALLPPLRLAGLKLHSCWEPNLRV